MEIKDTDFCMNCNREATHFFDGDDTLAFTLCDACAAAFEMGQVRPDATIEPISEPADVDTVTYNVHSVPMMNVAGMLDFCQRGAHDPACLKIADGLFAGRVAEHALRALLERRIKHTVTDFGISVTFRARDIIAQPTS